jgi:hypothetical protein
MVIVCLEADTGSIDEDERERGCQQALQGDLKMCKEGSEVGVLEGLNR